MSTQESQTPPKRDGTALTGTERNATAPEAGSEGLLLVVEDDPRVARFLRRGLEEEGFVVDGCDRGDEALTQGLSQPYDLAILDLGLPGSDGASVLRSWRERGMDAPVIVLTARSSTDSTVHALDAGADDYVIKPFSFEELLARIRAHLRRSAGTESIVRIGEAAVDMRRRTISREGQRADLSHREFQVLDLLLRHRGDTLSRSRMLDRVWGVSYDPTTNVVDVYVRHLRVKLDGAAPTGPSVIETVRGRGYRLRLQSELGEPSAPTGRS